MKLNVLLAIFLGAIGGLGMAFFVEYLDDKIEKIEDVEETLGLPVLASIPIMKNITEYGTGQPRAFIMSEKGYGKGKIME